MIPSVTDAVFVKLWPPEIAGSGTLGIVAVVLIVAAMLAVHYFKSKC